MQIVYVVTGKMTLFVQGCDTECLHSVWGGVWQTLKKARKRKRSHGSEDPGFVIVQKYESGIWCRRGDKWHKLLVCIWSTSLIKVCYLQVHPGTIQWWQRTSKPFPGGDGNSTLSHYNSCKAIFTEEANMKGCQKKRNHWENVFQITLWISPGQKTQEDFYLIQHITSKQKLNQK